MKAIQRPTLTEFKVTVTKLSQIVRKKRSQNHPLKASADFTERSADVIRTRHEHRQPKEQKEEVPATLRKKLSCHDLKQQPRHKLSTSLSQLNILQPKNPNIEEMQSQRRTCKSDFIMVRELGHGSCGRVMLSVHKQTGFVVALKIVEKRKIKEHGLQRQFMEEVRIHSSSQHPNIIQLYGFFAEGPYLYLVMELAQTNLYSLLKKAKSLRGNQLAATMAQVGRAVQNLHDRNIIHRDLKPENILVTHGVTKLSDFGWSAHCVGDRTTFCGTMDYASPEVLLGTAYDKKVDIWSLGVLCYELATGTVPFERKASLRERIAGFMKRKLVFPREEHEEMARFTESALSLQPQKRWQVQELLESEWIRRGEKAFFRLSSKLAKQIGPIVDFDTFS